MNRSDLEYSIALTQTDLLGPARYQQLLQRAGSIQEVFDPEFIDGLSQQPNIPKRLINSLKAPDWTDVDHAMAWQQQSHCHIVTQSSDLYPPLLRAIPDAPPLLYVMGEPAQLHNPQLAIVGSRKPSKYGEAVTQNLVKDCVAAGYTITSGLAHGIDGCAHQATLLSGGATVAVMGRGLDKIYPTRHTALARNILDNQGVLVSEFPLTAAPKPQNFPRRNRIISGLSVGTLVVEAKIKSGSLITAKLALDQGKEVFAVPGSIFNELSAGCHHLIQDGATLVNSAEDIINQFAFSAPQLSTPTKAAGNIALAPIINADLSPEAKSILDAMPVDPVTIDTLHQTTGLTVERLSAMLLDLELDDYVAADGSGRYQKIK